MIIWNTSLAQTETGIGEQPTDDPPFVVQPINNCPPLYLPPVQYTTGIIGNLMHHELYIKNFNGFTNNQLYTIYLKECLFYPYFQQGSTGALHAEFYSFNTFPFEHIPPFNAQYGIFDATYLNGVSKIYYDQNSNMFTLKQCELTDWPIKLSQLPNNDGADRLYSGIYEISSYFDNCDPNPIFVYLNAAYNGILYKDATDTKVIDGGSGDYFIDANLNPIITVPTVEFCKPAIDNIFGYPLRYFVSQNKNELDLFWNTERINVSLIKNQSSYTFGICEPYAGTSSLNDPNEFPPNGGNGNVIDPNNDISYLADTATYIDKIDFKPRMLSGLEVYQIDRNISATNIDFRLPTSFSTQRNYVIVVGDIQYGTQTKKIYK